MANYVNGGPGSRVLMGINWTALLVTIFIFRSGVWAGDRSWGLSGLAFFLIIICGCIAGVLSAKSIFFTAKQSNRAVVIIIIIAFITALLYLVPYIFWTQAIIPKYDTAAAYSVGILALGSLVGYGYLKRIAHIKNKKKKRTLPSDSAL